MALNFKKKPWFEIPELSKLKRKRIKEEQRRQVEGFNKYCALLKDEALMGIGEHRERRRQEQEENLTDFKA